MVEESHPAASKAIAGRIVSDIERGMAMMAIATLMAPGTHAIAKSLGDTMAPAQIAFVRFFFQFVLLLPIVWIGQDGRIPLPSPTQAIRGVLLASATLFFFWGLTYMPLADSAAIFFVEPLILTILSTLFLGESIGYRRLLAVVIGFAGALIVIRPSFDAVGPAAILPLLAALCFASYLAITCGHASSEDARTMQFWVCVFGATALFAAMLIGTGNSIEVLRPSWPAVDDWILLIGLGLIATLSHTLAINAIRLTPAGILAPFQYLEILGATVLGIIIFSDLPDVAILIGTAIIIGSGLYVFRRERLVAR